MYLLPLTVRYLSYILLGLMALVLPMAGLQQYFCTTSMVFVQGADDCLRCELEATKDCCGTEHKKESQAPDCMVIAKLLPDANQPSPNEVLSPGIDGQLLEVPVGMDRLCPQAVEADFIVRAGPPDPGRLFLLQERWLI